MVVRIPVRVIVHQGIMEMGQVVFLARLGRIVLGDITPLILGVNLPVQPGGMRQKRGLARARHARMERMVQAQG